MIMKKLWPAILILSILWGCSGDDDNSDPVAPDTTPPTVESTSPADGAVNVPVGTSITVNFSEAMDRWTFSDSTFIVSDGVIEISGSILYSGNSVILRPSNDLSFEELYTAVITDSVTDEAGNNLETDYVWSFTTTIGSIMPLSIGNKWEFLIETIDTLTGDIDSTIDHIEIVRDTVIQSETWYIDQTGAVYINKADGLWTYSLSDQPYLFLKFPAIIGDTYFGNPDLVETIRVDSTSVLRGVPHGNHICYLYAATVSDPTFKYKYYYKPNLGPVSTSKLTTGSLKVVERRSLFRLTLP
jgi:hypothetical protein